MTTKTKRTHKTNARRRRETWADGYAKGFEAGLQALDSLCVSMEEMDLGLDTDAYAEAVDILTQAGLREGR